VLEMLPIHTGWVLFDEFCSRYVYFFAGYAFATRIFDLAEWVAANRAKPLGFLALWAVINAIFVFTPAPASLAVFHQPDGADGLAVLPTISLALGIAGAMAIVTASALLAQVSWMQWLSWLGAHSIVIYLAFFLPMAVSRVVL